MKRWMELEVPGDFGLEGFNVDLDVDRAAENIAREQGNVFAALTPPEQDQLRRIAIAAFEGIGAE